MLLSLPLLMEFLKYVFINFIFEKLLSHEALVTGVSLLLKVACTCSQKQPCKETITKKIEQSIGVVAVPSQEAFL